jgi:peptide chain release factor subunit 1
MISEGLPKNKVLVRCQTCGHELYETIDDIEIYEKQLSKHTCPDCGKTNLILVESHDMIQELLESAEKFKTRVEFVSNETEEGKQLLLGFKGLAAILRFRPM